MIAKSGIGYYLLDHLYQSLFQDLPGVPNLFVINLVDPVEARLVIVVGLELRTKDLGMDLLPLGRRPSRVMHTIRDIADEQLLGEIARVHPVEYSLADLTMKPGHAIDIL